jgi:hypothetical protein
MAIPRNLGNLAQGANTSGVLGTSKGGTGLTTVGTNGQVLTSNGSSLVFANAGGGANLQEFTTSGTWTKPAGATFVMVEALGAGGAGAGSTGTNNNSQAGAGGGGGAYLYMIFKATDLTSTVSVTIGAGGVAVANNNGGDGGITTFGSYLTAYAGQGGRTQPQGGSGGSGAGVLANQQPIGWSGSLNVFGHFAGSFNGSSAQPNSGFGGGAGGMNNTTYWNGGKSYLGGAGGGGGGSQQQGFGSGGTTASARRGGQGGIATYPTSVDGEVGSLGCGGGGGANSGFITIGSGKSQQIIFGTRSNGGNGGGGLIRVYTW